MKPKIIKALEKHIKVKLAVVCLTIAGVSAGFFLLTWHLFSDFSKQKEHYRYNKEVLLEVHNLVSQFSDIQEYGNLFLIQKDLHYLHIYQMQIDTFQQKLEYIIQYIQNEGESRYFGDITQRLNEKKEMLSKLQLLFADKQEIDELYNKIAERLRAEAAEVRVEVNASTELKQDTVWREQKNFGRRLKDAFVSNKKREKEINTIHTTVIIDTSITKTVMANYSLEGLYALMQRYEQEHVTKIQNIETDFYALLGADQCITQEITHLLLQFHDEMLLNVISLGEEYEKNIHKTLVRSVIMSIGALFLITALIIFIFKNIKTLRDIYEALRLEKQKTEDLMESRQQLLLAISHDIKTPISSILGYLDLWKTGATIPKFHHELTSMQYSGKYILSLLNNLLEFTRLEQNKSQITKENIEILPFFQDIIDIFQPLCLATKNSLRYHFDVKNNPQILIDALKLKQITINLISNAVKYTRNGEIDVYVEEICKPKAKIKITVSDTGVGIPKEKLKLLFEPFSRAVQNSAGIEGTGLGLFVVKGLVELLEGEIEIHSEENQGSTVSFSIPCEYALKNNTPTNHLLPEALKIWVIDDDIIQCQVMTSMLQKLGHIVLTSTTKEAFEEHLLTECAKSNLVFTDLTMVDFNGFDVLQQIKSVSKLPVICFSGNATISKAEFIEKGFDGYLGKPFTISQLENIISSLHLKETSGSQSFSLNDLNELFDNDKETIELLLNTFTTSLPDDIQKIEQALAENNLHLLQQTAHRILPICKQFNASEVVPILEKIELSKKQTNIQFDNQTDVRLLIENLKRLLSELLRIRV